MNRINITRSSMPTFEEYIEEIRSLWDSRWLTNMGEKHNKLEAELEKYLQVKNVNLVSNGHMSLELCIQALGLSGEIITTPFTFASTVHALVRSGCTPVFCDINPNSYTIDASILEELITDKTVAIMPVHVYGNICDVEKIHEIAAKHGLKVIYDAAHTFGEKYKGKTVAGFGDASCFSFHATKVFHTVEGGAICFSNDDYVEKFNLMKNFGIKDEDTVACVGLNSKMSELHAAMGLCNLRHVDEEIQKRKVVYERYINNLKDKKGIKLNYINPEVESNYLYFPVVVDKEVYGTDRDEIKAKLAKHGIGARKYFYPLASEYDCYKKRFDSDKTPVAKDVSERILTLPIYADLTLAEVDLICQLL